LAQRYHHWHQTRLQQCPAVVATVRQVWGYGLVDNVSWRAAWPKLPTRLNCPVTSSLRDCSRLPALRRLQKLQVKSSIWDGSSQNHCVWRLKVVYSIYGTRGTRRGKVWLSRIVDTICWKVKTCRVRTIHGFREIEGQKSAAVKLTALALLELIWHPQNWRGARLLHIATCCYMLHVSSTTCIALNLYGWFFLVFCYTIYGQQSDVLCCLNDWL
jgi:hypothetical protein